MSGSNLVDALDVRAGAVRERLERLAGELHDRLGESRALLDKAVEGVAGEIALQLEKLGRALRFGEGADVVRLELQPARDVTRTRRDAARPGRDVVVERNGIFLL